MKVIIDDKIPYIIGALESHAEVLYIPGSKTTASLVKNADALVTRTRTICNRDLLEGSAVKFIATATIGYDHIDTNYCDQAGITWTNAPGCNAKSVEQYIAAALLTWALERREKLKDKTIGIVGVGNVGSKVERFCRILGMNVMLNDPPRKRAEGPGTFSTLEDIMEKADIITFHVPLNMTGQDRTFHMGDENFFSRLHRKPLVINSCRGEVISSPAVKDALKSGKITGFIADCWENEPEIDLELMDLSYLATPHIAGYSKDGKANGTMMSIRALSRFFKLGIDDWQPSGVELPECTEILIDGSRRDEQSIIAEAVLGTYNIEVDDELLRNRPGDFEKLRGDYPVRREYPVYTLKVQHMAEETIKKLREIGFNVISSTNS